MLAKIRSRSVRQSVLLIASFALYLTWVPWFAAILVTSILINFLVGKWLRRRPSGLPLTTGIVFNLALLGVFKYVPQLTLHMGPNPLQNLSRLALPLGISFWTFQAMSYLFDLYRGEELDPTLVEFALYMVFFPVTISGPVCRMPDMLPQFRSEETTSAKNISEGLRRIAVGVFIMQIAKLLGQGILAGDGVVSGFDRLTHWSGSDVWCLAFGYGLQLFFNFAGYTHIAVGAAKALGIAVPENFDRPFASASPSIFWTRWHMSLSFWIRDYVFFPLAPLRRELWWRNLALAFSIIVFGLWHKASLLFLLWGCYHGALLVLHRQVQWAERRFDLNPPPKLWATLSWLTTTALISLGWVLFRANSTAQAREMLAGVFSPASYSSPVLSLNLYGLVAAIAAGYFVVLWAADTLDHQVSAFDGQAATPRGVLAMLARWRWFWIPSLYAIALLFVFLVTHGQEASTSQFMYRSF